MLSKILLRKLLKTFPVAQQKQVKKILQNLTTGAHQEGTDDKLLVHVLDSS